MRTLLLLSLESCCSVELTLDVNGTLTVDLETVMLLSPYSSHFGKKLLPFGDFVLQQQWFLNVISMEALIGFNL